MNTDNKSASENNEKGALQIPLVWLLQEEVKTVYANQLIVTHAGPEFYLVFGEATPPFITSKDFETGVEPPKQVDIQPMVRIAVTPEVFRTFVDAMKINLERYDAKKGDE